MNEILLNQMTVSIPIHFFAYAPFLKHLRLGWKRTFALVALVEGVYVLFFDVLLRRGLSPSVIQLISMPLFGVLFFLLVDMEPGKILFLYFFSIAYLLFIRGLSSFLALAVFDSSGLPLYSLESSALCGILYLFTMPVMLLYINRTAQMVFEVDAPQIWQKAWLLPAFNTLMVLLFTYSPESASQINTRFLLERILLLVCMFLTYYFILQSIHRLRNQAEAEARAHYLKQITDVQGAQYKLLKSHMDETRKARHDLRHHLHAIQGYLDQPDLPALTAYIRNYSESIPAEDILDYCGNYAVNSILSYYAEKAAKAQVSMQISFCRLPDTLIPEPEFCVLLGNLLENALEACCRDSGEASVSPEITVRAAKPGSHMLTLAVDNTSPLPPTARDGHFLSAKHESFGIGTESVKNIAERYHGDARFEWRDGVFFASVMLNP